jgi:hypothetical protein
MSPRCALVRLLLGGALTATAACVPSAQVSGSVTVNGPSLGSWTLRPRCCASGDDHEFLGADLTDGKRALRVVDDPLKGYVVTLAPDGDPADPRAWLSPGASCPRFGAQVAQSADDGGVSGFADLDCALGDGTTVSGRVDFAECGAQAYE